jgi:hypothetical protein
MTFEGLMERNARDTKSTKTQRFKNSDTGKTINIFEQNPCFPCKERVVVGNGFEPLKALADRFTVCFIVGIVWLFKCLVCFMFDFLALLWLNWRT